jgi:hypothetical protein
MTFGAIKSRIADELVRPDLASQIALAVQDAIGEAATCRFWFNEVRGLTFTTVAGQDSYGVNDAAFIPLLSKIDTLTLTVQGQQRTMEEANALDVSDWQDGNSSILGEPAFYTRQANGIILWMTPNDAYPVTIAGTTRFVPLAADGDTNPYIEEGERYVRALAKAIVFEDVIRDTDEADRQWARAEREKAKLMQETGNRLATNWLTPFL